MSRAASTIQGLLLTQKAEVKEVKLSLQAGALTMKAIQTALKKKEAPDLLGTYKAKPLTLFLFGYMKGKPGQENKHELPPPYDSLLLFGDAILIASKDPKSWATPVPFTPEDYETFYTKAFGGFEDAEEEGDEEEEEMEEEVEEAEADAEAEAEAEAEVDDAAGDAEEEDEEEEEEEEDAEGDAEGEAEVEAEAEAEEKPVAKRRTVAGKGKKAKRATATLAGTLKKSAYLHLNSSEELQPNAPRTGCVPREKTLQSLAGLFHTLLTPKDLEDFETCIYRATLRDAEQRHVGKSWAHEPFVELYRMTAKHIAANFHPQSYVENTELFDNWKNGRVSFNDISTMSSYDLFQGRWKANFDAQQIREKRQEEGNRAMATDQFICTRCWKRECTYYEMQTRSADEPMTIFITCLNCGKHWRQ